MGRTAVCVRASDILQSALQLLRYRVCLLRGKEVKFVMGSREDYEWSRDKVERYDLHSRCHAVLFSPIFGRIDPREIVEWILADKLNVRFQLQMHKFIWTPTQRGV